MKLWYKVWRETQMRWAISSGVLIWACTVVVLFQKAFRSRAAEPTSYTGYIWSVIYKGAIRDLFVVLAMGLGLGGLLQERSQGTAGFTLALPVSRSRLVATRGVVGFIELIILAFLPALLVPALSSVSGESFPFVQSLRFAVLWIGGGAAVYGAALFLSALLAGEYSAWIACLVVVTVYSAIVNLPPLARFPLLDFFKIMTGREMPYFRTADHLLTGPLPWLPLLCLGFITVGFVIAASCITERQDF